MVRKIRNYLKELRSELSQEQVENMLMAQQIVDTNKRAFENYKNFYKGKKIGIIATGPSLKDYVPEDDMIYIGVNKAYRFDKVKCDYLFCQDYQDGTPRDILEEIADIDCVKFFGKFKSPKNIQIPEKFILEQGAIPYFVDDWPPTKRIFEDISYHPLMNFYSVVFAAIHFAIYTNPSEIHLIGCDCSNLGYFYKNGKSSAAMDKHLQDIYNGYVMVKEFVAKQYPDTTIISINPVGLKGMFEDRYTKE